MIQNIRAEIISVGDELLKGLTVNTNAAFIGMKLMESGFDVRWITTVGDDEADLHSTLEQAYDRASIIILTGGLGPTHDDMTKTAFCRFFDASLVFRQDILDKIEKRFRSLGRTMPPTNRGQAEIPENVEILENRVGTAPGLAFQREGRMVFLLPGVPAEMERMMIESVLPILKTEGHGRAFQSILLRTVGIPESELYHLIEDFPNRFPDIRLAFIPQSPGVVVQISASAESDQACTEILALGEAFIRDRAEEFIFGEDDDSLESVIGSMLREKRLTIAVAESCTGGLISHKLTNVPGSTHYFERGVVAYSNEAKIQILGVPEETIQNHGAVSPETALAMAKGVRQISNADIGLATTGIAGPGGATPDKPVGLVYIGYADGSQSFTEKHRFGRNREWNKERSDTMAMNILRHILLKEA